MTNEFARNMSVAYSTRYQRPEAVDAYESGEYAVDSYSSRIWQVQRPVLERILTDYRRARPGLVRLLDFACGTGRVLACLEPLVDAATGIDISAGMVAVARDKCRKAELQVGDILTQPDLLSEKYDVISCFRFLLNVEPELRQRVLCRLRKALREPDGMLLVNVHGNSRSLRHPALLWRRWREPAGRTDAMLNEMSPSEARALLQTSGFQIIRQFGFGLLPPTLYRTPLRRAVAAVDRKLAGDNWLRNRAIDMLFVCRPG